MARDPVKISATLDDNSLTNEIFTGITDGTEQLLINADGSLNATVNNAAGASAVNVQDGGNSLTVDATQLDIDDLSAASDNVAISDGTDTLAVNADGSINVTLVGTSFPSQTDDSAFTIATDAVSPMGALADETTPDSVDEGDVGLVRMTLDRKLLTRIVGATDANRLDVDASGNIGVTDAGGSLTIDNATLSVVGGGTEATALRVTLANDSTGVVSIDDNGGSITVDGTVTVTATDLDIRDLSAAQDNVAISDGTDTLAINADGSINAVIQSSSGTAVADYSPAAALASATSSNHDYTAAGGSFEPIRIEVSGESIGTFQILANAVVKGIVRTSVENPNAVFNFPDGFSIADTQVLRVVRTNDSNKAHDFDSTIIGYQN